MNQDRTNEAWLALLRHPDNDNPDHASALIELRDRLQRSIYFYLSHERSDLSDRSTQDLTQMADDMAQDATLRVIENLASFRGDSRFTTWAAKIAVRLAISDLRRARYRDFSLENITADGEFVPENATSVSGTPPLGPETSTERDEVMHHLEAALEQALTPRQRQALVAITMRGVPLDIVAEQMNTNRNALYKLLYDARRKLRTHLESQGLSLDYMLELFEN
jgi:RNA polymerase sigma-70 factor, ECF subfamily